MDGHVCSSPSENLGVIALPSPWKAAGSESPIESGQAWIYRVVRPGDSAIYALKRLKNPQRSARFLREVKAMQVLVQRGVSAIPPVVAADLDDEKPWFAMPWFELGSLEARVQSASYKDRSQDGLRVLRHVASALKAIHQVGYAHRDVKPGNILLTPDAVVLADFGLCLQVDDDAERLTLPDEAVGSRLYVAPENESGINEDMDQRPADFYAFAKVAWAVLAGRQPPARELQRETGSRLRDIVGDPRFGALDTLFDGLLNLNPRVRLQDWTVVIDELSAFERALLGQAVSPSHAVEQKLAEAARRISDSASVRNAVDTRSQSQRREEWMWTVLNFISTAAPAVRAETDRLQTLMGDAFSIGPGAGGASLWALAQRLPQVAPVGVDPGAPSGPWGGSAVAWIIRPQLGQPVPTFFFGIHTSLQAAGLWLVRIAWFEHIQVDLGGNYTVPAWLFEQSHSAAGPLPLFVTATLEAASAFSAATAAAFLPMASAYLSAVADGADPQDPSYWAIQGSAV